MRTRLGACLLVGAISLVGASCGDDDDEATTSSAGTATGAPLSKQEFIQQADQICADGNAEIEQAAGETFSGGRPSAEDQEAFFTDTVVPTGQRTIDDVRALTPPEGDEEEVTAFLDSAQSAIDEVEADPAALADVEEGGSSDPFAETNKLAKDYGFEECAE